MTGSVTSSALTETSRVTDNQAACATSSAACNATSSAARNLTGSASNSSCRKAIRKQVRSLRRALSPEAQQQAATQAAANLLTQLNDAKRVALYLENDGEISTRPLIEALWQQGTEVYLPLLHPFAEGHLLFIRYDADTRMQPNIYGIPEPVLACHRLCPAYRLDAIITPLVAFDDSGNRLGMGGGFYDRTLAQLPAAIKVIGLAHDCQRVPALPVEAWDVPLPAIVTPSAIIVQRS